MEKKDSQAQAIKIELIIRNEFNRSDREQGGLVDSDFICQHPFEAMLRTLKHKYEYKENEGQENIDKFTRNYADLDGLKIDDIIEKNVFTKMKSDFEELMK